MEKIREHLTNEGFMEVEILGAWEHNTDKTVCVGALNDKCYNIIVDDKTLEYYIEAR